MLTRHEITPDDAQKIADLLQLYLAVNAKGDVILFTHCPVADAHEGEWYNDLMYYPGASRTGLPNVTVIGNIHWDRKVWKPKRPPTVLSPEPTPIKAMSYSLET